jgi:guanylate kinase
MNAMNKILVLSGPSGAGKTTLITNTVRKYTGSLVRAVSVTTRPRRYGEKEGIDCYFVSMQEFRKKVEANELVNIAYLYDNYYATLKPQVDNAINNSRSVIIDINTLSKPGLDDAYPKNIGIFLETDMSELENRLRARGSEPEAVLLKRLDSAKMEIAFAHGSDRFSYFLKSRETPEATLADFEEILKKENII